MESGFNDTMHIMLSAVFSALVIAAMALSAVATRAGSGSTRWPRLQWWWARSGSLFRDAGHRAE